MYVHHQATKYKVLGYLWGLYICTIGVAKLACTSLYMVFMLGWWNGRHWRLDELSGTVEIQC